jgi:hypothetical protein
MVKTPDMNYNDPVLEKKGIFSRLFRRKRKDDPLTPTLQPYTRQEIALIEADRKRRAHEDFLVKQAARQKAAAQQDANEELFEEAQQFVNNDLKTPAHLVQPTPTPSARTVTHTEIEQAAVIAQQSIPVVAAPTKMQKFINAALMAVAFLVGMVGVNIVYNQLPTYPMVTVGIVAIAVSAGIVTSMAR